jgi:hypothetical protein
MLKKIVLGFIAFIVISIGAILAFIYFNKAEIIAEVKNAANTQLVNAKIDFKAVDISLFRQWPKLSVSIDSLTVAGEGKFKGVQLLSAKRLDLGLDLMQALFSQDAVIESLHLEEPDIRIYSLTDGSANYDITKPSTSSTSATTKLEKYSISKGKLTYDDRGLDMKMVLDGLEHTGKGNFTDIIYDLDMKTTAERTTLDYNGMRYLSNAKTVYKSVINIDSKNSKYTFTQNDLIINNLKLLFDGWVSLPNATDTQMDIKFSTPQNDFKSFLSIIPGAYTKDFEAVKADGQVSFDGIVKGIYNEKLYPAFKINLKVNGGTIKYPDLPLGITGVNIDAKINSPSSSLNQMIVQIPAFSLRIGSNPIEGYFNLKTPMTDPDIDTKMKGTLKFDELAKAYPMPDVRKLSGTMIADIFMKARMSQIDQAQYEQMTVQGNMQLQSFDYQPNKGKSVLVNQMILDFTPKQVNLQNFDAKVGNSDVRANGTIDNILAYWAQDKTMKGKIKVESTYLNATDFAAENAAPPSGNVPDDSAPTPVFDRWDFEVESKASQIIYDDYKLQNTVMNGHFTPNKMSLTQMSTRIGASDLAGTGEVTNVYNYLYDNQTLHGDINLKSNYFDLNQFMTDEKDAQAAQTPADIIPVPKNIDIKIAAEFAKLLYTNHTLTNLNGNVIVNDEKARLSDCTAQLLGGLVGVNGLYSTADTGKPVFNIDMALKDFGFKEAYQNIVTIKTFAPIAQFIDGKFNTNLSMSGFLGKDMTPDFKTISAAGILETFNAVVNNFKLTNEIGSKLNLDYLKQLDLKNSKNWFEIKDGKLKIDPFDINVKDTKLTIAGNHGLDTEMAYSIKTRTPRKTLEANPVGAVAASGLSFLTSEASKLGVNIKQGDFVNVLFTIGGTITSPKISFKVLNSDGSGTAEDAAKDALQAVADKAKDSLRTLADKEIDKAKDKATQVIDKATDSLKNIANQKIDEAKDKVVTEVKDQVGKVIDKEIGDKVGTKVEEKIGEKASEVLGDQGTKTVNDVKDKLNNWDPFKKKKKN